MSGRGIPFLFQDLCQYEVEVSLPDPSETPAEGAGAALCTCSDTVDSSRHVSWTYVGSQCKVLASIQKFMYLRGSVDIQSKEIYDGKP